MLLHLITHRVLSHKLVERACCGAAHIHIYMQLRVQAISLTYLDLRTLNYGGID